MYEFKEVQASLDSKVLTIFNEDEIISIEILEENDAMAAERWYTSLGYGVIVEDSQ